MNQYYAVSNKALHQAREHHTLSPVVRLGPIDDLEQALEDSWYAISRASHQFLSLLREFDLRQGWKAYGSNDCAEWLDFKLKMERKTALEKIRVARALWHVPKIDQAFAKGALSYSQVRALTRVANVDNEEALLEQAHTTTASGLERYCQRLRQGEGGDRQAKQQFASRSLHVFAAEGEIRVKLPPEALSVVQQALERLVEGLPEDPDRDYFAARADALVVMAQGAGAPGEGEVAMSSTHQVLVHVDASVLDGLGGESDYALPTVKRLCCSGELTPVIKSGETVLDVGRKHRVVPPKMRQALMARDRQCQFPGCHHVKYLDAHHIEHWCDGGETKLDNLILLCTHHHTLMHEGGFMLKPRAGKFYFARPDGRPIESPSSAEDRGQNLQFGNASTSAQPRVERFLQ